MHIINLKRYLHPHSDCFCAWKSVMHLSPALQACLNKMWLDMALMAHLHSEISPLRYTDRNWVLGGRFVCLGFGFFWLSLCKMATLIYTKEVLFLYASQQITQGKKKISVYYAKYLQLKWHQWMSDSHNHEDFECYCDKCFRDNSLKNPANMFKQ